MFAKLKRIHLETWLGIVSYLLTFTILYGITNAAVREPIGALMFAAFLSPGAAIPVYLGVRTVTRLGVRVLGRRPSTPTEALVQPATKADDRPPSTRFRLARHGSVDPAYGKQNAIEPGRS